MRRIVFLKSAKCYKKQKANKESQQQCKSEINAKRKIHWDYWKQLENSEGWGKETGSFRPAYVPVPFFGNK